MKRHHIRKDCPPVLSHPVRGAWVEIAVSVLPVMSLYLSHPVRGAWIETRIGSWVIVPALVAPREGCVG